MFFGSKEHRLLLAACIGEWDTAITHVKAAMSTGAIAVMPYGTLYRLRTERRDLLNQWASLTGMAASGTTALLADARAYATDHAAEIDSLLEKKGVS